MDITETLIQRNKEFAKSGYNAALKILPSRRTMILGCVDPRVDPMDVLKLDPGETAIMRNVGGRVDPAFFETMDILRTVSKVGGEEVGPGWNLVLLQHTKCGIKGCYQHAPSLLATQMRVSEGNLAKLEINDPYKAVAIDVEALRADQRIPSDFTVSGLVYDVDTGLVEMVVPPARLRSS
jgi:carbonic anhydrase